MSLFGSLTTAISGLQAQSSALGNISDNIANSQTTGYKRVDTSFSTLVLQSNSINHSPGGVVARPSYANSVAGNIETVDRTTNLAIRGQGYFSVSALTEVNGSYVATGSSYYTRDGSFELNEDRILVNTSGYALNGYTYNKETNSYSTTATPIQVTADIDSPVATETIELRANLPTEPAEGQAIQPTTTQIYDATGTARDITLNWAPGETDGTWRLAIDTPGAVGSLPLSGELEGYPVSAESTSLTEGQSARKQISEVNFTSPNGSGNIKVGDTYTVTVDGTDYSQTVTTTNASQLSNLAGVAQALADQINGAVPAAGVTATVTDGRLRVTSSTAGDDFTLATTVKNAQPTTNSVNTPVTTAATSTSQQQSVITFAGTSIDIGDVYTLNIDGVTNQAYQVQVTAANIGQLGDLNGVVQALASQVNANSATEQVIASVSGNTLTLKGASNGQSFSVGEQTGTLRTKASATAQQVTELSYPDRAITSDDTNMSVTVNGTTVTYTPTVGQQMTDELQLFANEINALALGVTATVEDNQVVLTADNFDTTFTVSARDKFMAAGVSNAPAADNTTYVTSVQGNATGSREQQRISITGVPGDVGATYSVTVSSPSTVQVDPTALEGTTTVYPDAATSQETRVTYTDAAAVVGSVFSLTVNGSTFSYGPLTQVELDGLATQPPTVAEVLSTYVAPAMASPDVTVTTDGNSLVLTGNVPGTAFRLTATDSLATDASSQFFDFSASTDTPTVGARYAVTMNGTTYSLQITDQNQADYPTVASVLDGLVSKVNNDYGASFTATAVKTDGATTGITLTAKSSNIALDGTQPVPDNFSRTITYTTTGDEVSLDEIASNLAALVNQESGLPVQASSVGGVITLTGNQDGVAFVGTPESTVGTTPAHISIGFGGTLTDGSQASAGTLSSLSSANVGTGNATVSAGTSVGEAATVTFSVDYGDGPQRITLDLGTFGEATGLTEYEGSAINVTSLLQDGSPQGTFSDVEIKASGEVVANYDNGNSRTIAQIPLVMFNNENALGRESGGVFTETAESGRARYTSTGVNGAGTIASSSLEGSNVDIAAEFTNLIVAQRAYTSNTKVITTTDEMLQDTINLKR